MRKCASLKKAKKPQQTKFKLIFSGAVKKNKIADDTIQYLNCVVHYLNMKTKGKLIDTIELKLCKSLKCDGV